LRRPKIYNAGMSKPAWRWTCLSTVIAIGSALTCASFRSAGQTPEQQQMWEAQRIQALADEKLKAEKLERERQSRRADPMGWVRSLDPMSAGGWEFRAVANDGSWAAYSSKHQMKRAGHLVTVWLRQEYAEPQLANSGRYLSVVEKAQYDCTKQQARALLVIYYPGNNLQGSDQTEEADSKKIPWNAIVPGTRDEFNFEWACGFGAG
jgi:hypothetical protein